MKDFIIRQATAGDKEAVLQIRDIELDYLAEYYDHFMASPNATSFILTHCGKIIGFNVAFLIDNGSTLVSRSGRVSKEYEGKSLYKYLDSYINDWAQSRNIKTKITAIFLENPHASTASFQKNHKLILTTGMINITFDPNEVALQEVDVEDAEKLSTATNKDITSWISSDQFRQYLFPHGHVVVDGLPFKLMDENIPIMTSQESIIQFFSNLKLDKNICSGLLSIGTMYAVPNPSYLYNIEIYGSDMTSLHLHILRHLLRMKSKEGGKVILYIYTNNTSMSHAVNDILLECGILGKSNDKGSFPAEVKRSLYEKVLG